MSNLAFPVLSSQTRAGAAAAVRAAAGGATASIRSSGSFSKKLQWQQPAWERLQKKNACARAWTGSRASSTHTRGKHLTRHKHGLHTRRLCAHRDDRGRRPHRHARMRGRAAGGCAGERRPAAERLLVGCGGLVELWGEGTVCCLWLLSVSLSCNPLALAPASGMASVPACARGPVPVPPTHLPTPILTLRYDFKREAIPW